MPKTTVTKITAENRRAQALQAAEQCIELLKRDYGAKRVILFGSLVGQGPWHSQSDIDLAVEGLAAEDFFKAYGACDELLPPDLELDLVPLEDAFPEMRARILGEVEMPDDPIMALKALVQDELVALNRVAQEMDETLAECSEPPTRVELRAIASLLHEFYNGIERIFERVAVGLDQSLPQGSFWHADLLTQMAADQEKGRQAVIDTSLHAHLVEYFKFRHFFRHAYGYTLEWDRLRWLAEQLGATLRMLHHQLEIFFESLLKE